MYRSEALVRLADANLETQPGGTGHWYQVAAPGMNHRQKSPPGSGCGSGDLVVEPSRR